MTNEIAKLRDAVADDMARLNAMTRRWEAIRQAPLTDQLTEAMREAGENARYAATAATADLRALRAVIRSLHDARSWVATLDENLRSDLPRRD